MVRKVSAFGLVVLVILYSSWWWLSLLALLAPLVLFDRFYLMFIPALAFDLWYGLGPIGAGKFFPIGLILIIIGLPAAANFRRLIRFS